MLNYQRVTNISYWWIPIPPFLVHWAAEPPTEVQVVEKVVEVPQVGSTTQGSVREVDVETEPTRQES